MSPMIIEPRAQYQGPLIKVPLKRAGTFIKMTEEEAIARGLVQRKARTPATASTKIRRPAGDTRSGTK